jgi:regulator of protease activity HflC (stomatin/prohibitin superfamily)
MLKETQRDALRAFKTELRTRAQEERAAARRKAQALRTAQVKEARAETWEQALRGVTPLR